MTRAAPLAAFALLAAVIVLGQQAVTLGDKVEAGSCAIANSGSATGNTVTVAEQAEFGLSIQGSLDDAWPLAFTNAPLEEGIKRLVGDNSLAIMYAPSDGAKRKIVKVLVYEHHPTAAQDYGVQPPPPRLPPPPTLPMPPPPTPSPTLPMPEPH